MAESDLGVIRRVAGRFYEERYEREREMADCTGGNDCTGHGMGVILLTQEQIERHRASNMSPRVFVSRKEMEEVATERLARDSLRRQLKERDAIVASLHRDVERLTGWLESARAGAAMAQPTKSAGGRFKRRPPGVYDETIATVRLRPMEDSLVVRFTPEARYAWPVGEIAYIDGVDLSRVRHDVDAQSWWHLCAIVGWPEWKARLLYEHPEPGGPSAVAGATELAPKRRARPRQEAVIHCQGDWLDD